MPGPWVSPWDSDTHTNSFTTAEGADVILSEWIDGPTLVVSKNNADLICLLRNNSKVISELIQAVEQFQKERALIASTTTYWQKSTAEFKMDEASGMSDIYERLCTKDPRYPMYLEIYGEDDEKPEPRRGCGCGCDNCFYGRDNLALEIIRNRERINVLEAVRGAAELNNKLIEALQAAKRDGDE